MFITDFTHMIRQKEPTELFFKTNFNPMLCGELYGIEVSRKHYSLLKCILAPRQWCDTYTY